MAMAVAVARRSGRDRRSRRVDQQAAAAQLAPKFTSQAIADPDLAKPAEERNALQHQSHANEHLQERVQHDWRAGSTAA